MDAHCGGIIMESHILTVWGHDNESTVCLVFFYHSLSFSQRRSEEVRQENWWCDLMLASYSNGFDMSNAFSTLCSGYKINMLCNLRKVNKNINKKVSKRQKTSLTSVWPLVDGLGSGNDCDWTMGLCSSDYLGMGSLFLIKCFNIYV